MNRHLLLAVSFICSFIVLAQSGAKKSNWSVKPFERKAFIENKGQFNSFLPNEHRNFEYCIDNNARVLFSKNGLTHVVSKVNKKRLGLMAVFMSEEKRERLQREVDVSLQFITMKWLNSNPLVSIDVREIQSTSYNYFIKKTENKSFVEECKGYSKLVYKNIYEGIDIEYFFTEKDGFKYNIIAKAGADLSQIKMQYNSNAIISLNQQGDVVIRTLLGNITDHAPISYLTENSQTINSSFELNNHVVSFNVLNSSNASITIDPWVLTPSGANPAYDNGVDGIGNLYLYGGSGSSLLVTEKYAPNATTPIWSLANGALASSYYGDMLVESSGNFYLSEGFDPTGAHTYKFSPTSALIWTSTTPGDDYREHWRLALNCITNKVIVAGGGTTLPTDNIAEIDINTGTLTNIKKFFTSDAHDMSGLCVDETGKAYSHCANTNQLVFADATNNVLGYAASGYILSEIGVNPGPCPTYYGAGTFGDHIANGYNMMTLGGTNFLFTTDGATIKKWDRTTRALLATSTMAGGLPHLAGGILADNCNNVWVGSVNGVYRYDFNLTQQQVMTTPSAVYDIAFSGTGDIMACGNGFATELVTGRITCGSTVAQVITDPCNPAINSVTVSATGGIAPYTYIWDDSGTGAIRNNLTPGWHIVVIKDANCIPLVIKDSVEVKSTGGIQIETTKACAGSTAGQIKFWLTNNKDITTFSLSPSATANQINDSTVIVTGLVVGSYSLHVTSVDLPCDLDTVINLQSIPQLTVNVTELRKAKCPGDLTGSAKAFVTGGQPYLSTTHTDYNFSWNSTPVQTDSILKNVANGNYIVSVTDSLGCAGSGTINIGVGSLPIPSFITNTVCVGAQTSFTNTSTITTGSIVAYGWAFGGMATVPTPTSNLQNPTFTYTNCAALNNATLVAVSDSGCIAFVVNPVTVHCQPSANFTVSNSCQNELVQFTGTSSNGTGTTGPINYNWNLNPITSTIQNPTQTYTNTGAITVSVVVTDINGCKDSVTKPVTIYALPTANFTSDSVCFNSPSHLMSTANGNGNPITSHSWDFTGDNIADVNGPSNINYTMPLLGNNLVNYTVTSTLAVGLTCKTATSVNVYTYPNPTADFSFVNKCVNAQPNTFDASISNTSVGTIVGYAWNFGDGQTANNTLATATNNFSLATLYNVTLTVTTNKGCVHSITKQVEVYEKPLVNVVSQDKVCLGSTTTFTAQTLPNSGAVTSWLWDTNTNLNTIETNGQQSNYTFNAEGTHTLNLIASTDKGCKDTLTRTIYVNYIPKPAFTVDDPNGCPEHCVTFSDQTPAITTPAKITQWNWNFGNGTTVNSTNSANQNICYTNATSNQLALYSVTLTTVTDSGCVASNIKPNFITVYPTPIASYTIVPDLGNVVSPQVHFENQSKDFTNWYWNFGDGPKIDSVQLSPSHTYSTTEAQQYYSQLIVRNQYGCRDTAQLLVDIAPEFVFYIPNAFTPNEDGINDGFIGVGIGIVKYEMWIYERWGTMVYYTDDITKPWYGKVQGKQEEAPQNVYTWKVELKDIFGKKHNYVGHVTLLR